jgi:hypothetical protein
MKPLNGLMSCAVVHVILGGLLALLPTDKAFSQADFYSGKTITIIRGGGPGGSGEFQTRSLCGEIYSGSTDLGLQVL